MLLMLSWCTTLKAVKVLPSKLTTLFKTPLPGRFTLTYRIVVFVLCCAPNRWVIGLILPPCIFRIGISDYVVVSRYTCRVSSCALVFKITVYISYFDGFFYSPRSFHIAFILPINYKLYVFKWRLLSKVQVFVQKPMFVHLPLGFLGSLATTSIIPINVLSCLNKSANISLSFRNFIQNIT